MQLIGLLLFKHYREEALEPYLKLLCSSGLRCRDEATFEVSKKLLEKIVKRHPACLTPALSFYGVNIDITDERGNFFFLGFTISQILLNKGGLQPAFCPLPAFYVGVLQCILYETQVRFFFIPPYIFPKNLESGIRICLLQTNKQKNLVKVFHCQYLLHVCIK